MIIGIPKEIKVHEYRVGATPSMVNILTACGHRVLVEAHAGEKIGFTDQTYLAAGAKIVSSPQEVYSSDMIIKVKELQEQEFNYLHRGQVLFCYLHLAPDPIQTRHLVDKGVVAIAYETIVDKKGRLPLLTPMSEIAGRLAIQVGATALQINEGGRGILLSGVPGVSKGKVVIIGGGAAGTEAARAAMGAGARVIVFDRDLDRLRELDSLYSPGLETLFSTKENIEHEIKDTDLVVGAVLIPGKTAPKLITREMVRQMTPGSVIVDISIDQGGCVETARPTTHAQPTYIEEGVVHYCVTNMPGACARTATLALTHATVHYTVALANKGYIAAMNEDEGLKQGLNVCLGHVTNANVAHDLNYPFVPPEKALKL